MPAVTIRAAFFDFGGVILSSPFEAFNRYEERHGLPRDLIRTINSTDPDTNAWARFERSEVDFDEFCELFEAEGRALGHEVAARDLMPLLLGEIRPPMVEAVRRCRARLVTALLTNNVAPMQERRWSQGVELDVLFDVVVESATAGVRKPEPEAYELVLTQMGLPAEEVVFLDDLGINLKPARAMGMTTIKVEDPEVALSELERVLGVWLR